MRGSLRERTPRYWQLRVFDGTDPISGKKRYRTRMFRGGKRAVSKELARLVAEVDGGFVAPSSRTVAALLDEWLAHVEHLGHSPSTLYNYRRLVEQLLEGFKSRPLPKVTPKLVDDLYRHLGTVGKRKPATVLRFHALLRAAFVQAVRWGLVDRNPIDRATPPRVSRIEIEPPAVGDVLRLSPASASTRRPRRCCASIERTLRSSDSPPVSHRTPRTSCPGRLPDRPSRSRRLASARRGNGCARKSA